MSFGTFVRHQFRDDPGDGRVYSRQGSGTTEQCARWRRPVERNDPVHHRIVHCRRRGADRLLHDSHYRHLPKKAVR